MSKKVPYVVRIKYLIQSIVDLFIELIIAEEPDIELDLVYTNKIIVSRYIILNYKERQYRIRVSDHDGKDNNTYHFEIKVDLESPVKLCSFVMDTLNSMRSGEEIIVKKANHK